MLFARFPLFFEQNPLGKENACNKHFDNRSWNDGNYEFSKHKWGIKITSDKRAQLGLLL